jgi:hypothetical protein
MLQMVLLISGRRFSRRTPPVDLAEHMRCLLRSSRIKVGPKSVENAGAKLLDETQLAGQRPVQAFDYEYDGIEYAGLRVNSFILVNMLCGNRIHSSVSPVGHVESHPRLVPQQYGWTIVQR